MDLGCSFAFIAIPSNGHLIAGLEGRQDADEVFVEAVGIGGRHDPAGLIAFGEAAGGGVDVEVVFGAGRPDRRLRCQ